MFALAIALFAAVPAGVRAAGEESAGGGSTPGEVVPESPGGSTESGSTGWTAPGGSTGASSGGGAATPGTSLGSGGGQQSGGSTGGEHSSGTGSSGHSAPEPSPSAPEPSYSAPESSSSPSFEEHASTPASSSDNEPASGGKPTAPPAPQVPVRIGLGAARAVAVSKPPPAPDPGLAPEAATPLPSSAAQVDSGSDGLPFGVVILLALIIVCAGALGARYWDRRRKQRSLDAGARQQAESEAVMRRIELEQAAAAFFEKGQLAGAASKSSSPSVPWRKPLRVFSKRF